jgi:hypothetical protein
LATTIQLDLAAKLDPRTTRRATQDLQKEFQQAGQQAGQGFQREFESRTRSIDTGTAAKNAAQSFGASGARAGKDFAANAENAVKRADFSGAGREAARDFTRSFERAADPRVSVNARSASADAGNDAGDSFASGFAGAGGLARLAGKGGPIVTAIVSAGLLAGKVLGPEIQKAMELEADKSLTAARLGLDPGTMKTVADGAGQAFASNFGASIQDNLATATAAIQSGLLSPTASAGEIKQTIAQLTDVSKLLGEDIPAVARSASQAIRTGIATDATGAFDLLVTAQQRGLNTSQDLLDTVNEYSTQWRKLGLTGPEAMGLLTQAVKAGARDTDVAADALKEFSIRVVDGSKTTTDAFQALGLNADEMARKFAAGGRTSADAFDQVVDKIRAIQDPVEQSRVAVELFGTQAEDLGGALSKFDLSTAVQQFGDVQGASQRAADTMVKTSLNEWQQAGRNIEAMLQRVKDSMNLSQWFSDIPKAINQLFASTPTITPGAPGVPTLPAVTPGPALNPPVAPPVLQSPLDVFAPTGPHGGPSFERVDDRGVTDSPLRHRSAAPGPVDYGVNIQSYLRQMASQWGLQVTSGVRPGDPGQHGGGFAADISGDEPTMARFAQWWASDPARVAATRQMIFQGPGFDPSNLIYGGDKGPEHQGTYAGDLPDHRDHVHLALEGAPITSVNGTLPVTISGVASGAFPSDATSGSALSSGTSGGGGSLGVPIDQDFGLSNGLPGLADNLVRMAGNAAFAPVMGPLAQMSAAGGGGYGLLGMLGAQNIANGLSPLGLPPGALGGPPLGVPGGPVLGAGPDAQPFPGAAAAAIGGPGAPQVQGRAQGDGSNISGGGIGVGGGVIGAATSAAASGLNAIAPGAGQAAETAMQLIERTIGFAGQSAAIGLQGLFETFSLNGSAAGDLSQSWPGKILAAVAGSRPAFPNTAGKQENPMPTDSSKDGNGGTNNAANAITNNVTINGAKVDNPSDTSYAVRRGMQAYQSRLAGH